MECHLSRSSPSFVAFLVAFTTTFVFLIAWIVILYVGFTLIYVPHQLYDGTTILLIMTFVPPLLGGLACGVYVYRGKRPSA